MPNIDDLLFRREHFPIGLYGPFERRDGAKYYDFKQVEVPPYHPAMLQDGLDFETVLSLLGGVIRETVADLESIADRAEDIRRVLERLSPDQRSGKVIGEIKSRVNGEIHEVPLIYGLQVDKNGLHFLGTSGTIEINPYFDDHLIQFLSETIFSEGLLQEYEMRDEEPQKAGKEPRWIEGKHFWHRHNVGFVQDVFSKNFSIAYDNFVVMRKYSQ
ncbi:MAG: hypothetical protein AABX51_00215 [Nanoarchaeota archaeon]